MTCEDADILIEVVAAGEQSATDAFRSHIEACPRCAGVFAAATRLELALRSMPILAAPPRFSASVLARIRRERWRADEQVDWVFNTAIGLGVAIIAMGALALFNYGSVTSGIMSAATALATAASQDSPAPPQPAMWPYLLACGLLGTSLLVWRWAENPKP